MTRERRDELILGALVISVAVHVLLMYVFRPCVMAEIPSGGQGGSRRPPMRVVETGPRPEPVKMEAVADVEPVRDAPAAVAEPSPVQTLPAAALPRSVPLPVLTTPELSQPKGPEPLIETGKLSLEAVPHAQIPMTPISAPPQTVAAPSAPSAELPRPSSGPRLAAVGTDPGSLFLPRFLKEQTPVIRPRPKEERQEPFKPSEKVLEKVDEKVVEQEKQAIRELVDSDRAVDLESETAIVVSSAVQGSWRYFRVRLSAGKNLPVVPKDFVLLIDASGSIGRERMISIRQAAKRLLRSATNTGDRFNVVAFRDKFIYAYRSWQSCAEPALSQIEGWIDRTAAHGRTDVFSTIRSVLTLPRDPQRPLVALVITDGEATSGLTRASEIITRFTELNDGMISLYMYGVKSTANRELIDLLTHGSRGEGFVYRGAAERAGEALDGFSMRFRDPVLSDLRLVFATGAEVEMYPVRIPNLYRGGTVELFGRVAKSVTDVTFELRGLNGGNAYSGIYKLTFDAKSEDSLAVIRWKEEKGIAERLRKGEN